MLGPGTACEVVLVVYHILTSVGSELVTRNSPSLAGVAPLRASAMRAESPLLLVFRIPPWFLGGMCSAVVDVVLVMCEGDESDWRQGANQRGPK